MCFPRMGQNLDVQLWTSPGMALASWGCVQLTSSGTRSNTRHGAHILRAIPGCSACAGAKQHLSTTKHQFIPSSLLVLVAKLRQTLIKVQTSRVHQQPGPCPDRQGGNGTVVITLSDCLVIRNRVLIGGSPGLVFGEDHCSLSVFSSRRSAPDGARAWHTASHQGRGPPVTIANWGDFSRWAAQKMLMNALPLLEQLLSEAKIFFRVKRQQQGDGGSAAALLEHFCILRLIYLAHRKAVR